MCNLGRIIFYAYLPKFTSLAYFSYLSASSYSKFHCQYQIRFVPYLLYLDSKIVDSWGHDFQFLVVFLTLKCHVKGTILQSAVPVRAWDYTVSCQGHTVLQLPFCTVVQLIDQDIIFPNSSSNLIFVWVLEFTCFSGTCLLLDFKEQRFSSVILPETLLSHQFGTLPRKAMSLSSVRAIF